MKLNYLLTGASLLLCTVCSAQNTPSATMSTFSGHTVADEGAWCWFADPRALHYEDNESINATYIGYIDNHGSVKATQVDWSTNTTSEVLIRSWFQPDDHDNPAFLVLPDKRIMIIYSRHTDEPCFYYRISRRPGDITDLGQEKRLATANNTTYPNPYILSDDPNHIYMCWRGIGWHPTVAQMSMPDANDDIKFTWGPYQMVQSTGARPYAKYMSNGKDKIYLCYTTGHPDNEYPNWLYCNTFNVNDKCLYDMNGKKLSSVQNGTFAVNKTSDYKSKYPATIVDATADRRDWIWNTALDKDGNPVIGMTKISQDKKNHDYYYAKWNGSKWTSSFVANGGGQFHHTTGVEMCYSAGMAVDRDNPSTVYCGVPVKGDYGTVHEIWRYTLDNNGKVTTSEAVTRNSAKSNARPFVIEGTQHAKGGADKLRLTWMNGDYYYWIVNTTYRQAYPTSIMAETTLPVSMVSKTGYTVSADIALDHQNYGGDILTINDNVTYGVDKATLYPYLKINNKTYKGQNVLATGDSWQTENTATTGGVYFSKAKLGLFNLTITYDGNRYTVYRNGIIDQVVEANGEATTSVEAKWTNSHCTVVRESTAGECLSQDAIKANIAKAEMDAISVPQQIMTDIVLPNKTASGKAIEWSSDTDDVLSSTGIVSLPRTATNVVLTASVAGVEKKFTVSVLPRDISQNVRATLASLNQTKNTATGFSTNTYATLDEGLLKGLRSYTVVLKANAKSLSGSPRLYDFGCDKGNSLFLRAKELSAGIKYNGGTTTMVNSPVAIATGREYCLAVTYDAATKVTTIYIDGEKVASGTSNQSEPYMLCENTPDSRNYVGRTQWWDSPYAADNVDFVGTIRDLAVYDIALTQREICNVQGIEIQEKEYPATLSNGNFEASYTKMNGSGVSTDRAIYVPDSWTVDYSVRNENDLTAFKNGDLYYSQFFASKSQCPTGKQTLWVRQRWGESNIGFMQEVKPEKGYYTLTADVFSSDASTNTCIFVDKTQRHSSAADKWQSVSIDIEADGETVYNIGCRTIHANSDGERISGFDNFILTRLDPPANGITSPLSSATQAKVFGADGRLIGNGLTKAQIMNLQSGVYIVNNTKIVVGN